MELLDRDKVVLRSVMTVPPEDEDEDRDWLIVLRLETQDAQKVAEAFRSSGFNVVYVG
ncbi:MAG: hypothetical protein JRJ03_06670 [Deltaproteobacteria bacterium]|nr:hypothetical protein [Deltaproteobacteria bacterium]